MIKSKDLVRLVSAIILCQLAGIIGSIFTAPAISTWYSTLVKPSISPPNWIFAPVWITLYLLMGISLYLVWKKGIKTKLAKTAIGVFSVQLALNALWSFLFFGLQNPFYAIIELIFLWIAIAATIYYFYKIEKTAAYLLIPYIVWVSFAAILNFLIYSLN